MRLQDTLFLFIDCQTTGTHPSNGSLLEMAWGFGRARDAHLQSLHSKLIQIPEEKTIPQNIQEMTGIRKSDLLTAQTLPYLYSDFYKSLQTEMEVPWAVIHYAQFEKPFLEDLFLQMNGDSALPFRILCSQKLARQLFPEIPSQNLRGLSGFLGSSLHEFKRAPTHVQATFEIWKALTEALQKRNVETLEDLEKWMQIQSRPSPKPKYEYRVSREKRLSLPPSPGIYRMKAKDGKTLYIGKATSLRDRVNSYFRGRKGRDPRKLEMITQVWDFEVTETETALEAALLENDEIKKNNPPYNLSLKIRDRSLLFYSRDFERTSTFQNFDHPLGPFRPGGPLEQIHLLSHCLKADAFLPLFDESIPLPVIREGFEIFCREHNVKTPGALKSIRSLLALGFHLLRKYKSVEGLEEQEASAEASDSISPSDVSRKFEKLLIRGAQELRRSRRLTRLLNSHVEWESEIGWKSLDFHQGRIHTPHSPSGTSYPWQNLGILEYDRMCVLWSEISHRPHRISPLIS